ncbi:MAG: DoxX family protein [Flammeovirgaceae bacterium]
MEIKTIIYWVLVAAMALPSFYFGFAKVRNQPDKVTLFRRLGYSTFFMKWVGACEMVSAVALFFDFTRMFAIAVSAIILLGAIFSHLRAKDTAKEVMAPVIVFFHLTAIFILSIF